MKNMWNVQLAVDRDEVYAPPLAVDVWLDMEIFQMCVCVCVTYFPSAHRRMTYCTGWVCGGRSREDALVSPSTIVALEVWTRFDQLTCTDDHEVNEMLQFYELIRCIRYLDRYIKTGAEYVFLQYSILNASFLFCSADSAGDVNHVGLVWAACIQDDKTVSNIDPTCNLLQHVQKCTVYSM